MTYQIQNDCLRNWTDIEPQTRHERLLNSPSYRPQATPCDQALKGEGLPSYSTFNPRGAGVEDDGRKEEGYSGSNMAKKSPVSAVRRRMVTLLLLFLALLLFLLNRYIKPWWTEEREYQEGFLATNGESYSSAEVGHFDGVRIQDLDASLVPGGKDDPKGLRRLIFVGDIHGCADELEHLLEKTKFNIATDHLIAVGDVISKGPDSVGVLDHLISIKASSVRGNHEDRVLALAPSVLDDNTPPEGHAEPISETFAKDSALLRQLSPHHLRYLHDMPLMLRIPPLPLTTKTSSYKDSTLGEEIIVVHAGIVPAVSLKKQDPYFVMNMRAIQTKTHKPMVEAESKKDKSKPWHDIWCWYNERLSKHKSLKDFSVWEELPDEEHEASEQSWLSGFKSTSSKKNYPDPQIVIYGHRSKEGLQIKRWTKGLDTGCVRGGKLTALVLNADGKQDIVQVGCKDHRK